MDKIDKIEENANKKLERIIKELKPPKTYPKKKYKWKLK